MINLPAISVTRAAIVAFARRGGDVQSGYIAYSLILAIFPFLIATVSLTGWLIGVERSTEAVSVLFDFAPEYLAEVLEPVLVEVLATNHGVFTVFILVSIWAAMRAVEAVNRAFDGIYGEPERGLWVTRKIKALVTVLVSSVAAVVLGLSILLAPTLINLMEDFTDWDIPTNINFLRYTVGVIVFYCLMWVLHWFLPNHHASGYPRWPGAVFSTIGWLVMATGLSFYLAYSGTYSVTYGAMAGIVITLLFLYLSAAIIIFGAELNAAIKQYKES